MTVRDQYETSQRLKYDQRGSSMISTGIAGIAAPVVLAEEGQQDLREDVGLVGPPALADDGPRPGAMAGSSSGDAGHLHGEVGLDGGREVRRRRPRTGSRSRPGSWRSPQVERAILRSRSRSTGPDEMAEEQVLAGDRGVGLELTDPVPVGVLGPQEMILSAPDRRVDSTRFVHVSWVLTGRPIV